MKRIDLIVLEDDPDERAALVSQIDAQSENFRLLIATDNAKDALKSATSDKPDAIILDLELNKGDGDGIEFLAELKKANLANPPYILVTTWNISQATYSAARELGADYIMSKVRRDYSASAPLSFLLSIKPQMRIKTAKETETANDGANDEKYKEKRLKKRIMMELNKVGVNPKSVGYAYLTDAIYYVITENKHKACTYVARIYHKAETSVERAMQNAINRTWNTADQQDLLTYYKAIIKSDRGVPTLNEFIYYYAQLIRPDFED